MQRKQVEIYLSFYEEDFYESSYLNGDKCAISASLERSDYGHLFHSGCFIQDRKTLERYETENLEELNEKVKAMYRATGRFGGRGKKLTPDYFKYMLKIKL